MTRILNGWQGPTGTVDVYTDTGIHNSDLGVEAGREAIRQTPDDAIGIVLDAENAYEGERLTAYATRIAAVADESGLPTSAYGNVRTHHETYFAMHAADLRRQGKDPGWYVYLDLTPEQYETMCYRPLLDASAWACPHGYLTDDTRHAWFDAAVPYQASRVCDVVAPGKRKVLYTSPLIYGSTDMHTVVGLCPMARWTAYIAACRDAGFDDVIVYGHVSQKPREEIQPFMVEAERVAGLTTRMASIASKDTTGTLTAGPGEVEIDRTRSGKKFALGGNQFRVGATIGKLHYQDDEIAKTGAWNEIDLDVVLTPGQNWDAECGTNGYQVRLWQNRVIATKTVRYIAQFRRGGKWLAMAPVALIYINGAGARQLISRPVAGITPTIDNDANTVTWANCFGPGIHYRYNLRPDEFFKTLIIDSKASLPTPTINVTGLRLMLVLTMAWDANPANGANGFAANADVSDLTGEDDDNTAVDEEIIDHADFAHADERGPLWWLKRERAWDGNGDDVAMQVNLRRRGGKVHWCGSLPRPVFNNGVYPLTMDVAITEEAVGAGADDGYYVSGTTNSDRMSRSYFFTNFNGTAITGFSRFTSVPIPQGATIDSATLKGVGDATAGSAVKTTVYGDKVADSPALVNGQLESTRVRTTASTAWTVTATAGTTYTSNSIAAVVQEIVGQGSWVSNNAMGFLYVGATDATGGFRTIENNVTFVAKFNATYTAGGGGSTALPVFMHHYRQQGIS